MSNRKERVTFTPGLGKGVRVVDRITELPGDAQVQPGVPGPTIPDDVSQARPTAFPPYLQDAIESDIGHGLGMNVCEVLIREFCYTLADTFSIAPHYLGDLLMDIAGELDPAPEAPPG